MALLGPVRARAIGARYRRQADGSGDPRDWRFILNGQEPTAQADRRLLVANRANYLLGLAQPSPTVTLDMDGKLQLAFVGSRRSNTAGGTVAIRKVEIPNSGVLFAAIAMAAAELVVTGKALMHCYDCGKLYSPRKTPGAKDHNFCPPCGPRASWKHSKRKKRHPEGRV